MKKRTLALAMACALSLSLLTACGGKEEPAPAPEVPEQSEPAAPEAEQPEVIEPAPGEPVEPELPFDLSHVDVTLKSEGSTFVLTSSLPDAKLYFGSEDESVATFVDGVVKPVGNGNTKVYAIYNGEKITCIVHVSFKNQATNPTEPSTEATTAATPAPTTAATTVPTTAPTTGTDDVG